MKIEKQLLRILLIFISIVAIYNIKSYCVVTGTWRMGITGETPWTNINISNAYAECESLNSATSTLGTNNLRAHLTTDADWSAMAIFSISQYGAATNNKPESTTGNVSGVYNPGRNWTFTTGISSTRNTYVSGLFNEDGSMKMYIRQLSSNREENNFVGFNDLSKGGTYGWFGSVKYWENNTTSFGGVSLKTGLFGVNYGVWGGHGNFVRGEAASNVTFRPVIWN